MSESNEQLNVDNIVSMYNKLLLPDGEPINPRDKYSAFAFMCDCTNKKIKYQKWSCVVNCTIECTFVFVIDS